MTIYKREITMFT